MIKMFLIIKLKIKNDQNHRTMDGDAAFTKGKLQHLKSREQTEDNSLK
jgi:hypothetical protein